MPYIIDFIVTPFLSINNVSKGAMFLVIMYDPIDVNRSATIEEDNWMGNNNDTVKYHFLITINGGLFSMQSIAMIHEYNI